MERIDATSQDASEALIRVERLSKKIGKRLILEEISFDVAPGEILGVAGANGSGKSALLRILAGQSRPTAGTAIVAAEDVRRRPHEVRRRVGYVASEPQSYSELTVEEYLTFWASVQDVPRELRSRVIEEGLTLAELLPVRDQRLDRLSQGLRQRVELTRAILHDPPVVILDEPSQMLDAIAFDDWFQFIRELTAMGKGVVLASGQMARWFPLCHRIAWLHRGRLMAWDTLDRLCERYEIPHISYVRFKGGEVVERGLSDLPGVLQVTAQGQGFRVYHAAAPETFVESLMAMGQVLVEVRPDWEALERTLLAAIGQEPQEAAPSESP